MKTDELILSLAQEPAPAPLNPGRIGAAVVAATGFCGALFLALFGIRDGLPGLWSQPLIVAKTLLPALACLLALPALLALLRPGARAGFAAMPAVLPLTVAAGLWIFSFAALEPAQRFVQSTPFAVVECVGLILVIAAPSLWLAIRVLGRGATTRPRLSGALAGLVVGAGASSCYSFFCLQDNPLFYVTWYGTAIAITAAAGAWLGARRLRW